MADYCALDLGFAPGCDRPLLETLLYAALDDFQPVAIQEQAGAQGWRVFFREARTRDAAADAVASIGPGLSITAVSVPDDGWARRSQAGLTAVTVGRIIVAPPWDPLAVRVPPAPRVPDPAPSFVLRRGPDLHAASAEDPPAGHPPEEPIVIVIDPSMGFGTGHHQTTRLCLSLMQSVSLTGRRVVDIGTGSGVLAIAAWRLGAAAVLAVDNDPDALRNARENIDRNGGKRAIALVRAELQDFTTDPADVVTANLTAAVLTQQACALRALIRAAGVLIVSGFSPDELPEVARAFDAADVRQVVEGEWTAALIRC